jgi:hypothetical protein
MHSASSSQEFLHADWRMNRPIQRLSHACYWKLSCQSTRGDSFWLGLRTQTPFTVESRDTNKYIEMRDSGYKVLILKGLFNII